MGPTTPRSASGGQFPRDNGFLHAEHVGRDETLFSSHFGSEQEYAAATAACLLLSRQAFDAVGGFPSGYRYGTEDVELCCRFRAQGERVIVTGRSILFHFESATQDAAGREFKQLNRTINRRLFYQRWGPKVYRQTRIARMYGDERWAPDRYHVGITRSSNDPADGWGDHYTALELGDALRSHGWRVSYLARKGDQWCAPPADLDVVIALMDTFDPTHLGDDVLVVAWMRNWAHRWLERPWFDRYDLVFASSRLIQDLVLELSGRAAQLMPLATNPARFSAGVAHDAPQPPSSSPETAGVSSVRSSGHWARRSTGSRYTVEAGRASPGWSGPLAARFLRIAAGHLRRRRSRRR